MKQPKWIVCPSCEETIGPYNENVERSRSEQSFKSWCSTCKKGVTPLYI